MDSTQAITDNTITGNNLAGIYLQSYSSPTIHNNNLYDNSSFGLYNGTQNDIDARNNWWGDAAFAEMQAGGNPKNISAIYDVFDEPSLGTVNYSGWLDAQDGTSAPTGHTGVIYLTDFAWTKASMMTNSWIL